MQMIPKYVAYLLVSSEVNRFFHLGMLILQLIQTFLMLVEYQGIHILKDIFLLSIIGNIPLSSFFIVLEVVLLSLLVVGFFMFRLEYKKTMGKRKYTFALITKSISYLVAMFKTVFLLPINYLALSSFKSSQDSVEIGLGSIMYVLYFIVVVPISFLGYCNKFCVRPQSISFPYVINVVSCLQLYLHIFVFTSIIMHGALPYLNGLFFILSCLIILWNSPSNYKRDRLSSYLYSLMIGEFVVSVGIKILLGGVETFGGFVLFVVCSLGLGYMVCDWQQSRVRRMLLGRVRVKEEKRWWQWKRDGDEILLYYLVNYSFLVNDIVIYFFLHEQKCVQIQCVGKRIFSRLQQGGYRQQLFKQVKQFFIRQVQRQYNPTQLQGLGEKQIQKVIEQKGKLYLLIIQLMIIKDQSCLMKQNLRKAYYFLKQHQQLLKRTPQDYTFLAKVQIAALLIVIEDQLIQTVNRQSLIQNYSLKAQEYYQFQDKLHNFKKQLATVCDTNVEFWRELEHQEPDSNKLKLLINRSNNYSHRVEKMYRNLINNYHRVSIVVYDIMLNYSSLVLNCQLSSHFNPFISLIAKYNQEVDKFKKENIDNCLKKKNIYYQQTATTPVCIISAQKTQTGNILWENSTFRTQYHFLQQLKKQQKDNQININQIILPFYRQTHHHLINSFAQQETLIYNHGLTIVYKKQGDRFVIQRKEVQVQIIPSIKFGLKLLVFFKPCDILAEQKLLIADQQLERFYVSDSLLKEWSLTGYSDDEVNLFLQNILKNNKEWVEMLNEEKSKQGDEKIIKQEDEKMKQNDLKSDIQLKLDLQQSDYKGRLVKTLQDPKGVRYLLIQISNMLTIQGQQQQNLFSKATKSADPQAAQCLKVFMQNTIKSFDQIRKQSSRQQLIFSGSSQFHPNNQLMIPLQMIKVIQEKSEHQAMLQNVYLTISRPSTPRKIIQWRLITVVLMVIIMGAMIANMVITGQRKILYQHDISSIENYNRLIQYIARSSITLRQYNYEAYKNISSPKLPFYQNQLKLYQTEISTLLQQLSQLLTGEWQAFDFRENGQLTIVQESEFVVIANYLLSSITFLSTQPVAQMSFPFLESQFFWYFGMTKAQSNYQDAIWNGLYVALLGMLETRLTLASKVQKEILFIPNQLYIFPTIIGALVLTAFIVFSLVIEMKSNKLIGEASKLLEEITFVEKQEKIGKIQMFRNNFVTNTFQETQSLRKSQIKSTQIKPSALKQSSITESQSQHALDANSPSNQTDRQLKFNQMNEDTVDKYLKDSPLATIQQKGQKPNKSFLINPNQQHTRTKISVQSSNRIILLFYICVVIPFMAYFIAVFLGGYYLNKKIMFYISFGSEMYHLNTHQEYNYLYTRETFLFQGGLGTDANFHWGQVLIPGILTTYESSRFVEMQFPNLQQDSRFAQLKTSLDSANLCDNLAQFSTPSIYYNITFTKAQCQSIANHVMTKGFRAAYVYFVQAGVQLINRNMDPQFLTKQQRISYLQGPELRNMKVMLAYFEEFYRLLNEAYQENIDNNVNYYVQIVNITSIVLIVSLLLIIKAINYRWAEMKSQSKQVQSILRLISFAHIKQQKELCDKFLAIDYHFYE